MTNFIQCPRCCQIVPSFGHDCPAGRYQMIATGDSQHTPREPDPRDALYRAAAAHIAELTADRDRLAAEVKSGEHLRRALAEHINVLMEREATARRALEYYATSLKPPYGMADDGKRARDALADLRRARNRGSDG